MIYHITTRELLEKARLGGVYGHPSIAEVGFVYCTTKDQTASTMNRKFKGVKGLLLLELDTEEIVAKIVYEDLKGMGEKHPHIYGPIPFKAIVRVLKLIPNKQGEFSFPKEVLTYQTDLYYKKTIIYPFQSHKFEFEVAETLFSTFDIDHGTDILIRSIVTHNPKTILDLGCGYGPLGIILANSNPQAQVTMLDRDLLAVRYTNINIVKNNISNARALGSVGVEVVSNQTFDLIVSNIPAKIGDEAIAEDFIQNPIKHLNSGGELWVVVVNKLNRLIPKLGGQSIRNRKGHTVYKFVNS